MFFNSIKFLCFFPIVLLLYYIIPSKYNAIKNIFILLASYVFYMAFKPALALVLALVTLLTYLFAIWVDSAKNKKRNVLIVFFVIASLLPLLIFKYYNFLNDSLALLLAKLGISLSVPGLNLSVPIGISFFTFQALSYLLDVYYKKTKPQKNLLNYALYVSFFPSIVCGPINRANNLLPQIENPRKYFDYNKAVSGAKMLLWGMFLKVVIADNAGIYVDMIYEYYYWRTSLGCLLAAVMYSVQIYADFAGYSLMAIGCGKILGFSLQENFRRPYFAVSFTDFWHRWHISLSSWLRDYVYIPLKGSRCSKARNYFNIFVTFLISGIWHGAAFTFIFWGVIHGVVQIIEKFFDIQKLKTTNKIVIALRIVVCFLLITFAWVFFRMPDLSSAFCVIEKIFSFSGGWNCELPQTFLLVMIGIMFLKDFADEFAPNLFSFVKKNLFLRYVVYVLLICLIVMYGAFDNGQFIYANF